MVAIGAFQSIRPRYLVDQGASLDWVASVHQMAEKTRSGNWASEIPERLNQLVELRRKIATRGIQLSDLFEEDSSKRSIYSVAENPQGAPLKKRLELFDQEISALFAQFYLEIAKPPAHLIHVTCTGYVAPSPAQKWVSFKEWGAHTTVTHAYHMGCYASIPALRMGKGFLISGSSVDIVHTEFCSLHMHPLKHDLEQLVVQGLFADGFIKYSLFEEGVTTPHFVIKALREEIIPGSTDQMTWICEEYGFGMTLSKEVPLSIARHLKSYLVRLKEDAGLSDEKGVFYAVHPGGPKILESIERLLQLSHFQIQHSKEVLCHCGNMSSATLPHIWELMLRDETIPHGAHVISLAFGPGLCIAGSIFVKVNP